MDIHIRLKNISFFLFLETQQAKEYKVNMLNYKLISSPVSFWGLLIRGELILNLMMLALTLQT